MWRGWTHIHGSLFPSQKSSISSIGTVGGDVGRGGGRLYYESYTGISSSLLLLLLISFLQKKCHHRRRPTLRPLIVGIMTRITYCTGWCWCSFFVPGAVYIQSHLCRNKSWKIHNLVNVTMLVTLFSPAWITGPSGGSMTLSIILRDLLW